MKAIVQAIDFINEWTGSVMRWAVVALILLLTSETIARFVFRSPTIWGYETATMLSVTVISMGWGYVHRHNGHVRVDVLYRCLSLRGKTILDVVCTLLFFFPLMIVLIYTAYDHTWFAWTMGEKGTLSYWYPPLGPVRTVLLLGLSLFALQGVSQFIRDLYVLMRKPL